MPQKDAFRERRPKRFHAPRKQDFGGNEEVQISPPLSGNRPL
ncbi:hypothetical protein SAMN00120144_4138, partial [Hymenobacter roseosalivarius DSM 11622]